MALWRLPGIGAALIAGMLSAAAQTPSVAPGMRAVTTEVAPDTSAGGFILPNDRVDVMLTNKDAGRGAETILTDVRVLDFEVSIAKKTATLELSPTQAEALTRAKQRGVLSLALRSIPDGEPADKNAKPSESGNSIVRFGTGIPASPSRAPAPPDLSSPAARSFEACTKIDMIAVLKTTSPDLPKWIALCGQSPDASVCEHSNTVLREQGSKARIRCQAKKR